MYSVFGCSQNFHQSARTKEISTWSGRCCLESPGREKERARIGGRGFLPFCRVFWLSGLQSGFWFFGIAFKIGNTFVLPITSRKSCSWFFGVCFKIGPGTFRNKHARQEVV